MQALEPIGETAVVLSTQGYGGYDEQQGGEDDDDNRSFGHRHGWSV
jgi:hypothetical protein